MLVNVVRYMTAIFVAVIGLALGLGTLTAVFSGRAGDLFMIWLMELCSIAIWTGSYFIVRGLQHVRIFRAIVTMGLLAGSLELLHFLLSWWLGPAAFGIGSKTELYTSAFYGAACLSTLIWFELYCGHTGPNGSQR
jgi:hypothetical protein